METLTETVELDDLQQAIGELMMLFAETARFHEEPSVKAVLGEAGVSLASLYRRIERRFQQSTGQYVVTLVGLTNVGKSTLLNALLGHDLAPRKNGPCTAVPVEFIGSDSLHVVAYYQGTAHRSYTRCTSDREVHECLARLAVDGGGHGSSRVARVEVGVPNLHFSRNLVIADTPGFGAAHIGNAGPSHDDAVTEYLKHVASQVMWVVAGGQGVTEREKEFHGRYIADVCEDLIVTGCEDWTSDEMEKSSRVYEEGLGRRWLKLHYVSGKLGVRARQAGDHALFAASGVARLQARLEDLADGTRQKSTHNQSLETVIGNVDAWRLRHRQERRVRLGEPFWRPDSWNRWKAFLENHVGGDLKTTYLERLSG
jgi:GTP-binding protein EngB required for normal cell division